MLFRLQLDVITVINVIPSFPLCTRRSTISFKGKRLHFLFYFSGNCFLVMCGEPPKGLPQCLQDPAQTKTERTRLKRRRKDQFRWKEQSLIASTAVAFWGLWGNECTFSHEKHKHLTWMFHDFKSRLVKLFQTETKQLSLKAKRIKAVVKRLKKI